jgi:hypothetical protein
VHGHHYRRKRIVRIELRVGVNEAACSRNVVAQAWYVCATPYAAIWSCAAILIPAAALAPGKMGERIDRSARIGMRVKPASSFGADAAPQAHPIIAATQMT